MKRILSLIGGLLLAAVIGLAQGKWEQVGVSQYGTGGINRSGERIDNSYNAGKFNSEVKSTSKNNPYVYFRKGQFSVPAKTYQPGQTLTVSMSLSVRRHSGSGTPKGSAGATLVGGQAGQGTSVPSQISVSGKDAAKSGSVEMAIPSRSQAGNNFSIVYSCFDIKVVYLYRWVEDKPVAESVREPVVAAEAPVLPEIQLTEEEVLDSIQANEAIVLPDYTILPPADSAFFEESLEDEPADASIAEAAEALQNGELTKEDVKNALKEADTDTVLSLLGFDLTKKDLILYGIIGGLGLLVLILLLVLLFRKNPAKKAAKEEARKAAAEAKAAAKAEAAEKAAAAKAERDAKLAEQRAAAAEKAAAAKAAQEAKRAELKAAQEAKAAELKQKQEAAKAEREAKLAGAKAAQEAKRAELQAAQEAKRAELKAAQEAKAAELKAKREAALAAKAAATAAAAAKAEAPKPEEKPAEKPAGKKFCENCGAPLDPDAVFCENCGTKVQ